jgi:cytochrome oxidase Cu insertion factor (SCO1/SenC/PrrC family)
MGPSPRRPARLLVILLALGAGLLAACGGPAAPAQPPANQGLVLNRPTPQRVGLTNQEGQAVTLASLRGTVVVLAPFLSLCQDECPLVTGAFIALQRDVRAAGMGNKVVFLETTVDPGRDTVARLAAYQKEFGADWDL